MNEQVTETYYYQFAAMLRYNELLAEPRVYVTGYYKTENTWVIRYKK